MGLRKSIANFLDSTFAAYFITSLLLLVLLAPIFFTITTSLKTKEEVFTWPPTIFPKSPTLNNYIEVIINSPMPRYVVNSLIIAIVTTIIVVGTTIFTSYGLSQYRYKGSNLVMLLFLGARIVPSITLIVPFYIIFSRLKLLNTYWVLVIINVFLCYPLAIWMLKSFFDSIPRELIEAGRIDGCTRIGVLFRIVIPITMTGIAAVAIITFLWTWNEYLFAVLFTNTPDVQPLTVGAQYFVGDELVEWHLISTTAMFAMFPGLLFFMISQRAIVQGLTQGAVKG